MLRTQTLSPNPPDFDELLRTLGFRDPENWSIRYDRARVGCWDVVMKGPDGNPVTTKAWTHRAYVEPRTIGDPADLEELTKEFRRKGALKAVERHNQEKFTDEAWLVVFPTDWQTGKGAGGGPERLRERVERLAVEVLARRRALRAAGVQVGRLLIAVGGDMIEACSGHYASQEFLTVLDDRQQMKMVRRLFLRLIDYWAPHFEKVVVMAAPGNHGEKRQDGKVNTTWSDNSDVEFVETVADVLSANPDRYGHVGFLLPDGQDLTVVGEFDGLRIGAIHGHQCSRGGSSVQTRVLKWWGDMAKNNHPIGRADVLLTGHHHHFEMHQGGTYDGRARTWFQGPPLDGGSAWWEHKGGDPTRAATVTFVAARGEWDHLHLIPADPLPEVIPS